MTQGNTLNNDEECCAAAHAVDKDLLTRATTESEAGDGASWLKVQFGRTNFIHKVEIYCRFYTNWYDPSAWCVENVDRFKGCVDAENNVDVSVYQGKLKQGSCGTLQLTHGLEQSDQIYTLICNTRGDEVRLSKNTGVIAVYEMVVIGTGKLRVLGLASAYH